MSKERTVESVAPKPGGELNSIHTSVSPNNQIFSYLKIIFELNLIVFIVFSLIYHLDLFC